MEQTSIAVSKKSKEEWEKFKNHPDESMENMINRILKHQKGEDEELLAEKDIAEIKASITDIEQGNYMTQEQMKKKYGL